MNKGLIGVTISLVLSVMLVMPPLALSAGGGRGGGAGGGHVGGGFHGGFAGHGGFNGRVGMNGFAGHGFHNGFHNGFHGRPFFNHRFGRFFPFSTVAFVGWPGFGWPGYGWGSGYGWPYFYGSALSPDYSDSYNGPAYNQPAYAPPASAAPTVYSVNLYNPSPAAQQPAFQPAVPAVYEPPPAYMAPAPSVAPQGVVEYEGGRYELRGDGMTVAYRWVWIPNPPSGPPGVAPSSMKMPASGELAPARRGTVYHWVDDQGVMHMTDRWQAVPQHYRDQAKQNLASS
ncbi:MAG TPA: hypothetical protein VMS64_38320 [Candidatus Methylomirabilis sp.]|nr:hypothetical protein [Candidatus Methylomirabilis sp.]